ncbi:RNA polymerase subunit sigma-70 [Bacillus cereus]|uniref:RNA polymerase sigma factor n=1 Tax=Bacillus cereus TaxID=1396 RepID=UPI000BF8AF91|nr:RNA polymerase sigma factor [Bacillus cereus]PFA25226.1 RNA polymerase subunit sigma-70 [Bacillus cereus]PGZ16692.1 RNA polymerase subunit sigma-70 [Bacillus cereus]
MDEILLIQQAKKGNKEAFNQLLQPYIQKAYRTSYLILNDKGLAEDAVQESLIQTYQSMKRFNENIASFKTWFHQILIHTTLKQKRKKRFAFLQIETWFHIKDESTSEGNFLEQEETEMIMDMVRKLSMKHQVVIILFYYQELSIIEIAQGLDIKEGTVKLRLHQAREKLKEYLTKMNFKNQETEVSTWINK